MSKSWECKQCGSPHRYGILSSFGGAPDECRKCGHTEFTDGVTVGTFHELIDDPRTVKDKVSRREMLAVTGVGFGGFTGSYLLFGRVEVEEGNRIIVDRNQFRPQNLETEVGEEVRIQNNDPAPISLVAASDNWEFEAEIDPEREITHTFEEPGIYDLESALEGDDMYCRIGVDTRIADPVGGWF